MPYGKLKCYHKSLWANYSSSIIQPSTLSYYMVNCYFNFFLTAKVPISAWICLTEVMSWILQKGVGDKALNQLEKSISSKLEAIVARQIHAQFQTSSKQALQVSSFWSTSTISLKALFAFSFFFSFFDHVEYELLSAFAFRALSSAICEVGNCLYLGVLDNLTHMFFIKKMADLCWAINYILLTI